MEARDSGGEAVAVSGSAMAERRRRALADLEGTSILLFDSSLRIRLATGGGAAGGAGEGALVGAALADAVSLNGEHAQVERAARRALSGLEVQVCLGDGVETRRELRFVPVEGTIEGGRSALVAVSQDRAAVADSDAEVDALRARASDLETLASAARALARSTYAEEARRTVCEAAAEVADSELAALLEPLGDGGALVVTGSHGADIEGRAAPLDRAGMAAIAFRDGKSAFSPDLAREGTAAAWPLGQVGVRSAIWQPVRRAVGLRGVIAVGWMHPTKRPSERLMSSLEVLAGEAAVAIDRAAALERLSGLARTDPLTQLSNRRAWQDELGRELARAGRGGVRLSIGMIDLDELKAYNDRWGHAAGDRLLLTAAARWRKRLRLTDLLARIGGDEFALTLPGCSLAEAAALGDQLRAALPDGLSCSVGVAEWVEGEPAERLLARADEALYAAKDAGRNRTVAREASA